VCALECGIETCTLGDPFDGQPTCP
jgi:hypothetical protein